MPRQHTYCIIAVLVAVLVSLGTFVSVENDTTCPESVTAMWSETYCPRTLAEAMLIAVITGSFTGGGILIIGCQREQAPI